MSGIEQFGQTDLGVPVQRISLMADGITAKVLSYGAVLQELRPAGVDHSVVLGLRDVDAYQRSDGYFGAIVGRCANRIHEGRFQLDGQCYQVDQNFLNRHMLHGGRDGSGSLVWTVEDLGREQVTLSLDLPNGHMGFPGNMRVEVTYKLFAQMGLEVTISAKVDAPSICNFAAHNYFNLSGLTSIKDHVLKSCATHYLPVDDDLIPIGKICAVDGTAFDFRHGTQIGESEYDHNFCMPRQSGTLTEVCHLSAPSSLVDLTISSTESGLQVYSGFGLNERSTDTNSEYGFERFAGLALEPQGWPDAINNPRFPSPILRPGDVRTQTTVFSFGRS